MALETGAVAPDFGLLATPDQKVSLSEFDGPVVLIFYPADWSPVCSDELSVFSAASRLFKARGAQLLGNLGRRSVVSRRVQGTAQGGLPAARGQ